MQRLSRRLDVLASGARLDVAGRVKKVLHVRGIRVRVAETPGWHNLRRRESLLRVFLEEAACDPTARLVLDVSAAGPEGSLRALDLASQIWRRPFEVASFEAGRGTVCLATVPRATGSEEEQFIALDVGDPMEFHQGQSPIGPAEMLSVFGLRLVPEDPYGPFQAPAEDPLSRLVAAARGVLESALADASAYTRFRKELAALAHGRGDRRSNDLLLPKEVVPAPMADTFRHLADLGLVSARDGNRPSWLLRGPQDRCALFFLAGGWLEILTADILSRSFDPPRPVERNAGTVWGHFWKAATTYAGADALFVDKNRLLVVSCKNEFLEDRLLHHLDRFRALAAEYGEALVRPVLLSTRKIETAVESRCRAYEIGHLSGSELLRVLCGDMATSRPRRLLNAIRRVCPGPPMPGSPES